MERAKPKKVSLGHILFPNQKGVIPAITHPPGYTSPMMKAGEPVIYNLELPPEEPPEYKDLIIRLVLNLDEGSECKDQFILRSSDGSYESSKVVKDDLIEGDDYLDLLFKQLDTSKNYTLEQIDPKSGVSNICFDQVSYFGLSGLS